MATNQYDAVVVGARCAGSPTAMLLAEKGYKVLVVDKATFPSDTISTHLVHPPGMAALRKWGLKDELVGTGCPPIDTYMFDLGPIALTGHPGTPDEPVSYGPRRTVLDKLLVDAADAIEPVHVLELGIARKAQVVDHLQIFECTQAIERSEA